MTGEGTILERRKHFDITHIFEADGKRACVIRLSDRKILEDMQVQEIGQELFQYAEEHSDCELCINFDGVDSMASTMFGKLLTLDKKVRANVRQPLYIVGVRREIDEVFRITRLNRRFNMYRTLDVYIDARGFAA